MIYINPSIRASDRDGYIIITCVCDTVADLPAVNVIPDYTLDIGCSAHVIEDSGDYIMMSNGTWIKNIPSVLANTYTRTEIDSKIADVLDLQGADRAAIIPLINTGAKNYIKVIADDIRPINTVGTWSGDTYTRYNIQYTINADGTITVQTNGGAATNGGALAIPCRALTGDEYHLNGIPSGASGYDLRVGSGSTYRDTGSGLTFTTSGNYNIQLRVNTGTDIPTPTIVRPMLTMQAWYDITPDFVPYAPTNRELYDIVRGL